MRQDNFICFHNCVLIACSKNPKYIVLASCLAPARCWIHNQKLQMSEAITHHNIVMYIQFLRKLIINKQVLKTTNFNIFISTKQHLAHQKEVKSTIDVLTFSIHYRSMVRGFLLQILQKISMILILHSVCSVQIDSFTILFSL